MSNIGERIKKRRKELGMTQEDLSNKLGYKSKTTIAKIENGTNDIMQNRVIDFAKALHTTPAYLMGYSDLNEPNDISAKLQELIDQLQDRENLQFDQKPMDNMTRELLRMNLENTLAVTRLNNGKDINESDSKNRKGSRHTSFEAPGMMDTPPIS